jgi:hypothetical protein
MVGRQSSFDYDLYCCINPSTAVTKKAPAPSLIISLFPNIFQSESGATESGSISSYEKDSEIEMQIAQDTQEITVPITVCISIMIG